MNDERERRTHPSFPFPLKPKFRVTFSTALEIVGGLKGTFFARVPNTFFTAHLESAADPTTAVAKYSYSLLSAKYFPLLVTALVKVSLTQLLRILKVRTCVCW